MAGRVGNGRHQVATSLCRGAPAGTLDQAGHGRRRPALGERQGGDIGEALDLVRGKKVALGIDRVGGKVEAKRLALGRHPLRQSPAGVLRQADRRNAAG